eukprot:362430-Chlamydomonas_euryale.AAC.13
MPTRTPSTKATPMKVTTKHTSTQRAAAATTATQRRWRHRRACVRLQACRARRQCRQHLPGRARPQHLPGRARPQHLPGRARPQHLPGRARPQHPRYLRHALAPPALRLPPPGWPTQRAALLGWPSRRVPQASHAGCCRRCWRPLRPTLKLAQAAPAQCPR